MCMIKSPSSAAVGPSCVNHLHIPCLISASLWKIGTPGRISSSSGLRHTLRSQVTARSRRAVCSVRSAATNSLSASKSTPGSRKSATKQEPGTDELRQRQVLHCLQALRHPVLHPLISEKPCMLCRSVKPDRKSNKSKPATSAKKSNTSSRAVIVQQVNVTPHRIKSRLPKLCCKHANNGSQA